MEDANKKFDETGRLVSCFLPSTGTLTTYAYGTDWRTITITNERNSSNHTTTIEQKLKNNGDFIDTLKTEEGEIYTIRISYDEKGRETKYEQINKVKKTNLIRTTYHSGEGETSVFVINYNGNKEVGFKADMKKLKPKS